MSERPDDRSGGRPTGPTHHEWGGAVEPATAVVQAVAACTGRDVTDLRPLATTIDTDSLNRLLTLGDANVSVSFTYEGYDVRVSGDGHVTVSPRDTDA